MCFLVERSLKNITVVRTAALLVSVVLSAVRFVRVVFSVQQILKMSSKTEKDKAKQIQDKCQAVLNEMLRDEDNKYCVDCDSKGNSHRVLFNTPVIL